MAFVLFALCGAVLLPSAAFAYCDPPIAPAMTSEALAREYRDEFQHDFELYFYAAEDYLRCLEIKRTEVIAEISETVSRYERFMKDSRTWK